MGAGSESKRLVYVTLGLLAISLPTVCTAEEDLLSGRVVLQVAGDSEQHLQDPRQSVASS